MENKRSDISQQHRFLKIDISIYCERESFEIIVEHVDNVFYVLKVG